MLSFIVNNLSTIIISALLLALVCFIVYKQFFSKKKAKSCCLDKCDGCSFSGNCH